MAKSSKRPPKVHPISEEIPESVANPETPFDGAHTAEATAEALPQEAPAPEPRRGRPPIGENKTPKVMTFFQRMASISPEDWGTRAKVRLYRLAPIIDRLRGSDVKFITVYQELVTEEKIKLEWGSGRYRLYLNYKMPQGSQEKELDQVDIDILDMKYPPVVPAGEWMDDPRNKQWAWGRRDIQQPGQQPQQQQTAGIDPLASLNTFMDIQDRIEDRLKPAAAPAPAVAQTPDPWAAAERILNMRNVESPVVAILEKHQEQAAKAQEEERKRNHEALEKAKDREHELNQKLLELTIKNATPPAAAVAQKGMLEQLMEFSSMPEKLDPIKKLFGWGSSGDGGGRPAKTTGMDLARDIATKIIDSPIAEGLSALLGNLIPQRATPPMQMNGAAPLPAPQQQPAGDSLSQFIGQVVNPALMRMYLGGFPGDEFATWMWEGYPERLQELQQFKHPLMPGVIGARVIIAAYKQSPLWPNLASKGEPAFIQFVNEFCAWRPEETGAEPEEAAGPVVNGAPVVVLTDDEDMQEGRVS